MQAYIVTFAERNDRSQSEFHRVSGLADDVESAIEGAKRILATFLEEVNGELKTADAGDCQCYDCVEEGSAPDRLLVSDFVVTEVTRAGFDAEFVASRGPVREFVGASITFPVVPQ